MDRVTGIHPTDARGLYVLKHFSQLCLGLEPSEEGRRPRDGAFFVA